MVAEHVGSHCPDGGIPGRGNAFHITTTDNAHISCHLHVRPGSLGLRTTAECEHETDDDRAMSCRTVASGALETAANRRSTGIRGWPPRRLRVKVVASCMTLFRDRPDLLLAFRRGDRAALEAVYWAYIDRVERLIRAGWRTPAGDLASPPTGDDIGDLVQETFARAFTERTRLAFDGLREFGPYLATIARNLLVDWARRRGREVPSDFGDLPSPVESEIAEDTADWADAATMKQVDDYIASLPEDLRAIHRERYVHGRSQRDAATALGISRQQLRTREQRLRNGLRRALGRD